MYIVFISTVIVLTVSQSSNIICKNSLMRKPYSISSMVSPKASSPPSLYTVYFLYSCTLILFFGNVCGEINKQTNNDR